jgi:hypothetical protein
MRIDLQNVFELPAGAVREYAARSPWKEDAGRPVMVLLAGQTREFHLAPFEVLTLDILPRKTAHD